MSPPPYTILNTICLKFSSARKSIDIILDGVVETKAESIEHAKELAKNQDLGQVVIHKQDETIQTH